MKPTKFSNLIYIGISVAIVGYFAIQLMVGFGLPAPAAGLNMILIQPALSLILVLSAIPMMRYRAAAKKFMESKGPRPKLVDSAYSVRTVALAKSVSLTGSIFAGWFIALVIHELSGPEQSRWILTVLATIGSASMVVCGILIENLFRVPPDENGDAA